MNTESNALVVKKTLIKRKISNKETITNDITLTTPSDTTQIVSSVPKKKNIKKKIDIEPESNTNNINSTTIVDNSPNGEIVDANPDMFFKVDQKTEKQQILDNPDTFIGSVLCSEHENIYVYDEQSKRMKEQKLEYIAGLFKLFDEGIVNCRDHAIRMQSLLDSPTIDETKLKNTLPVTYINIDVLEDGTIIMENDGNGIDVVMHPTEKVWIPEIVFGHLRSSTNYDKNEKKIVGGKNGYGFKLVLVWSTYGKIETVDHIRKLSYTQEFKNNLSELCPPIVKPITTKKVTPYTKVTFKPDYQRFGIEGLTPDFIALLQKRVYDICALTSDKIKVRYNGEIVPLKGFKQYIDLYVGNVKETPRVYEESNPRWEYAVCLAPLKRFTHVSFVNGIHTSKGGKHVEYIREQIVKKTCALIESKKKVKVNPTFVREQLMLFLRCDIENPSFDSQTKECLNTPIKNFGSSCEVSDTFIDKVCKLGIMEIACQLSEIRDTNDAKKTDGTKTRTIKGIPKLDDANFAGTVKSKDCTLILCEGDSAKSGVVSGLSSKSRDTIGIYPLKGKLINPNNKSITKVNDNTEFNELKQILGLQTNTKYETIDDVHKKLRYGKILILTDQDLDGSHIKALCLNLFNHYWESLLKIPNFINFMNTPIIKATKGDIEARFYNAGEYELWKKENNNGENWKIKYYKGLGTSVKHEFIDYFKTPKIVNFVHTGETSQNALDLMFNPKRADDRKDWLMNVYDRNSFADTSKNEVIIEDFVNKEAIHYSNYDCDRSIPNIMDGLKTSLRKILFGAFKKNLTSELKVAQFSGYVSEVSSYHHGEASLNEAIIGMAQNYMSSNNINLLYPSGQFGSRLHGGSDHASPRYIFTCLEKITRCIYPKIDDNILDYLDDDGQSVEPTFYAPIIPMALVNGAAGIGTAFSTKIPQYNPKELSNALKNKLITGDFNDVEYTPYYEGFLGTITKDPKSKHKYFTHGHYEIIDDDTIRVTELPIGTWTQDFMILLDELMQSKDKDGNKITPIIKSKTANNTDSTIEVLITFNDSSLIQDHEKIDKVLKLTSSITTSNMHLFTSECKLKKYNNVNEVLEDYFKIRLHLYAKRKDYIIKLLNKQMVIITNKLKYLDENLNGTIDLRRKNKDEIQLMFETKGYARLELLNILDEHELENYKNYKYLLKMTMDSVTDEMMTKMREEFKELNDKLIEITNTSIEKMWLTDLEEFEQEYTLYLERRTNLLNGIKTENKSLKNTKKNKTKSNHVTTSASSVEVGQPTQQTQPTKKKILKKNT